MFGTEPCTDGVSLRKVLAGGLGGGSASGSRYSCIGDELAVDRQPIRVVFRHLRLDPVRLGGGEREPLRGPTVAEVDPCGGGGEVGVTKVVARLYGDLSAVSKRRVCKVP
ncbi:hypothetical protein AB0890_21175 [Streptomyces sp. NPDC005406]|uniref:hypothetical protein n=1 Tax=Streptomyces sp. NPDC005406 TaxID=3155339 RepID=UPI003454094E